MRVLIGINNLQNVSSLVYGNHIQVFSQLKTAYPKDEFMLFSPARMSIDRMRNMSGRYAIDAACDYLMFIDDDVLLPAGTFQKLKAVLDEYPDIVIVGGLTIIRGYPYPVMAFRKPYDTETPGSLPYYDDYKEHLIEGTELVECEAIGFSCALIKVSELKKLTVPFFITGPNHTEDVYFCLKGKKEFGEDKFKIYMHSGVKTGHLGMPVVITADNREALRAFDESEDESLRQLIAEKKDKNNINGDRSLEYLQRCV